MAGLGEELDRLREGRTTFAAFSTSTGADWRRMAEYLYRRWWLPAGVEVEDVQQEVLLAAWQSVPGWDPDRGVSLRSYVVWSALTGAKKWLHRQRNAARRDGKADGRFPVSITEYNERRNRDDPTEPVVDLSEPATAEETVEAREQLTFVLGGLSYVEREVLMAVVASGGDLGRAAAMLFSDPVFRLRARIESERDVEKFTDRVARIFRAAASRRSDES